MKLYKIKTNKSELLPLIPITFEDDLTEGEMMLLTDDLGLFTSIALNKHYKPNLLKQLYVDSIYEDQLTENELLFLENIILGNTFWHYDNKYYVSSDFYSKYEKVIKGLSILLSEYIKDKYDDKDFEEHTFFGVYDYEYRSEVISDCEETGLPYFEIDTE